MSRFASEIRLVSGRPISLGHGHVVQPQEDGELAPVMDDVVQHLAADHADSWRAEQRLPTFFQSPRLQKVLIARRRYHLPRFGSAGVELLEYLGG